MEIQKFKIEGPFLATLKTYHDERGFFVERFNETRFRDMGLPTRFVQDNFSRSLPNVLRGMHCQYNPDMGKLVTCTHGEIFDVIVDVRAGSTTYGEHVTVTLKGNAPQVFWVPPGFLHGFCVTSDVPAEVLYKVDVHWSAAGEVCVLWNDPDLKIPWPNKEFVLSPKDLVGIRFRDYQPR